MVRSVAGSEGQGAPEVEDPAGIEAQVGERETERAQQTDLDALGGAPVRRHDDEHGGDGGADAGADAGHDDGSAHRNSDPAAQD